MNTNQGYFKVMVLSIIIAMLSLSTLSRIAFHNNNWSGMSQTRAFMPKNVWKGSHHANNTSPTHIRQRPHYQHQRYDP